MLAAVYLLVGVVGMICEVGLEAESLCTLAAFETSSMEEDLVDGTDSFDGIDALRTASAALGRGRYERALHAAARRRTGTGRI